jgi:hypothetical protein
MRSCTYQHLPAQCVPSLLLGRMVNQSRSEALLISMYLISACSSSLSRACHCSASRGPARTVSSGIFCTVARVVGSHDWSPMLLACTAGCQPAQGACEAGKCGSKAPSGSGGCGRCGSVGCSSF